MSITDAGWGVAPPAGAGTLIIFIRRGDRTHYESFEVDGLWHAAQIYARFNPGKGQRKVGYAYDGLL